MHSIPLYEECQRPDCKFGHPTLTELKGLLKGSQGAGGIEGAAQGSIPTRAASPIRTGGGKGALKRPGTPLAKPSPFKKLSIANVAHGEEKEEQNCQEGTGEEEDYYEEEGEDDPYR